MNSRLFSDVASSFVPPWLRHAWGDIKAKSEEWPEPRRALGQADHKGEATKNVLMETSFEEAAGGRRRGGLLLHRLSQPVELSSIADDDTHDGLDTSRLTMLYPSILDSTGRVLCMFTLHAAALALTLALELLARCAEARSVKIPHA